MAQAKSNMSKSVNLHLISDSTTEDLTSIANAIRAQHNDSQIAEHRHSLVLDQNVLDRVLKEVEAAPGIVLYTLQDQRLANVLVESCRRLQMPCIEAPKPDQRRPHRNKTSRVSPATRFIVLGLLAGVLTFWIITRSVAAYLAETSPEAAMHGLLAHPRALITVADVGYRERKEKEASAPEVGFNIADETNLAGENENQAGVMTPESSSEPATQHGGSNPPSRAEIQSWLQSALREDPLNARAFTLLAQIEASRNSEQEFTQEDEDRITPLMRAAAQRSLQESNAVQWMMRTSLEAGNYPAALHYADTLLRSRQAVAQDAIIALAQITKAMIARDGEPKQLTQLLATNPPWRRQFLTGLPKYVTNALTPLNILLALKDSPHPPVPEDLVKYLDVLVRKGFYDIAYYAWLQFLPPEQLSTVGLLFNGGFESPPSPSPFDWTFSETRGVTIRVLKSPNKDGSHALFLDFGAGRVEGLRVSQLLMLPPGDYRMQGKYISELISKRGLQWRLLCTKDEQLIGKSQPVSEGSGGASWEDFSFSFSVPARECPAQRLELIFDARYASERFMSGSIWYDELKILRESQTAS